MQYDIWKPSDKFVQLFTAEWVKEDPWEHPDRSDNSLQ